MHRLLPAALVLASLGLVAASGARAEAILPGDIRLYNEVTSSHRNYEPGVTRRNSSYIAQIPSIFARNPMEIERNRRIHNLRAARGDFAPR